MKTTVLIAALMAGLSVQAAQAEGARHGASFEAMDTDGNGEVTLAEIEAAQAARFAAADTNGDGGISAEEMLAARELRANERATHRAERRIARLDTNGDGLLQPEEMQDRRSPVERMFDRVDANEDGVISAEEFEAMQDRRGGGHRNGSRDRG